MLRIVDKDGKLKAILEDDSEEPTFVEKVKEEKIEDEGEEDGTDSEN